MNTGSITDARSTQQRINMNTQQFNPHQHHPGGRNNNPTRGNQTDSEHLNRLRQERKNFMIVFKMPEISGTPSEQWNADFYMTQIMLKEMDLDYLENRIDNVERLGKDSSGNSMRPLRVAFKTNMDRETAVRNGFKLKDSSEFENVGVSRDLIMHDRIEARENYIRKRQQNQGIALSDSTTVTPSAPTIQIENPTAAVASETTSISPGENDRDRVHPQGDGVDRVT